MSRTAVIAAVAAMFVCLTNAQGEVDSAEAFKAHAKLMTGGVWVAKDKDGKTLVDRHVASKTKNFVQIRSVVGDEFVAGIYGVDPKSHKLTLWSFREDGGVGIWTCTDYKDGRWTWEGRIAGPEGETTGKATVHKVNDHEIKLVVEGDEPIEQVWKRE